MPSLCIALPIAAICSVIPTRKSIWGVKTSLFSVKTLVITSATFTWSGLSGSSTLLIPVICSFVSSRGFSGSSVPSLYLSKILLTSAFLSLFINTSLSRYFNAFLNLFFSDTALRSVDLKVFVTKDSVGLWTPGPGVLVRNSTVMSSPSTSVILPIGSKLPSSSSLARFSGLTFT